MAEPEEAVFARLQAVSGVTDLVGVRVYPQLLPQRATKPAVTYQRISADRESAMGADIDLVWARMQISSWAATYSEAKALARQVRLALQRWGGTAAGVVVDEVFILNEIDRYEDEVEIHRVIQDFKMWYRE